MHWVWFKAWFNVLFEDNGVATVISVVLDLLPA
jgi:hypothetical protein